MSEKWQALFMIPRETTKDVVVEHKAIDPSKDDPLKNDPLKEARTPFPSRFRKLTGLIVTTIISSILLASNAQGWTLSDSKYHLVNNDRASIGIIIQILSSIFGIFQVTAICTLINLATRSQLGKSNTSLDGFRFWFNLCIPHMEWTLPFRFFTPLLFFVAFTFVPSALWAGAMSPINVIKTRQESITIPQYRNISLITEYLSEYNTSVPQERNVKGAFAYNVGIALEGSLLISAATATTIDGNLRQHRKLDNSGFTYIGRSYGVGASAGLSDDRVSANPLATAYFYEEVGYDVVVDCIYNTSTEFVLEPDGSSLLWAAKGNLPNSNDIPEFSVYPGRSTSSIVALGVAHNQTNGTKYLGIATGLSYVSLNTTQCSMVYLPTTFNVSISTRSKNITVTPLSRAPEIDPSGNISHVASRQLELVSNDQTNLYQSLLGNSFLASVGDYNLSMSNTSGSMTEAASTVAGLKNSITVMLDDILVGYASAQLVVGKDFTNTTVTVQLEAIKLGESFYIYAVVAFNAFTVLLVICEAYRTRIWKHLVEFDFTDLRDVVVGSSRGGPGLAQLASAIDETHGAVKSFLPWKFGSRTDEVGRVLVSLDRNTSALVSAPNFF